jgi:UDP-GlcNAc:undecaprenyl-phosphate GlcNAc-1-phosphate transferase
MREARRERVYRARISFGPEWFSIFIGDPTRDERRVHKDITPRWGGIGIFLGIVIAIGLMLPFAFPFRPFPPYLLAMGFFGLLIVLMGAWDDLVQLSAKAQLGYLLAAGLGVQFFFSDVGRVQISGFNIPLAGPGDQWFPLGWVAFPATAIYIFVVTKTMDTIDGIDGLAGGIAAIAATTLSVIATFEQQPRVALIAAAIAGASIGFLRYNFNPAKIFMGTGGAQVLGFLLACLSIVGAFKTAAALAILVPLMVFAIPLFDAAFVVVRRLLTGTPLTQPDKRHLHHTLLGKGFSQKQTVWILYLIAMAVSGLLLYLVRTNS